VLAAQYYWPYRPFSMKVAFTRPTTAAGSHLDQLVRVSPQRVQLLVRADLTATTGRLFGASFLLPDGYDLLSATGAVVSDYYVTGTRIPDTGNRETDGTEKTNRSSVSGPRSSDSGPRSSDSGPPSSVSGPRSSVLVDVST